MVHAAEAAQQAAQASRVAAPAAELAAAAPGWRRVWGAGSALRPARWMHGSSVHSTVVACEPRPLVCPPTPGSWGWRCLGQKAVLCWCCLARRHAFLSASTAW